MKFIAFTLPFGEHEQTFSNYSITKEIHHQFVICYRCVCVWMWMCVALYILLMAIAFKVF